MKEYSKFINKVQKIVATKQGRLGLALFVFLIILTGSYYICNIFLTKPVVQSYEECILSKGSITQETYPQVCITKNGLEFTQVVPPLPLPLTEAEKCYEQVTNIECEDGQKCMTNPASSFCVCMGGLSEIKEGIEGQYGICLINGEEYEEWDYYGMMTSQEEISTNIITDLDLQQGWYWGDTSQRKLGTPENWTISAEGTRSSCWHKPEVACGTFPPSGEQPTETSGYLLEKSEGSCENDTQCVWAGEGCGGGHGMCTNDPEKYEGVVTTCDVDNTFPANRGYTCGCIETLSKCGWKK
jgi:putative hemolysin